MDGARRQRRNSGMNAGRAIRHLEEAGLSHQQAAGLVEIIQDDVLEQIATKDFVGLACERVKNELRSDIHALRAELKGDIHALDSSFGERHASLVKWLAGIMVLQTASIIFGTVGLIEILK
jgi:hypothetical protein